MLLTISIGLCLCITAPPASAGQITLRGMVVESEAGTFLETVHGDFFLLQGIDALVYMDALVVVTGELGEDELGNDVILVRTIREEKPRSVSVRQFFPGRTNLLQLCDCRANARGAYHG
jgi:hypothetical protein